MALLWERFLGAVGIILFAMPFYEYWTMEGNHKENYKYSTSNWETLKETLSNGDLLECPRRFPAYAHWGVYIGDGEVIHVMTNSTILRNTIEDFMKNRKCRINNLEAEAHEKGLQARSNVEITKEAIRLYDEFKTKNNFRYNLITSNCQHFVTLVRFGEPISSQIENVNNTFKLGPKLQVHTYLKS